MMGEKSTPIPLILNIKNKTEKMVIGASVAFAFNNCASASDDIEQCFAFDRKINYRASEYYNQKRGYYADGMPLFHIIGDGLNPKIESKSESAVLRMDQKGKSLSMVLYDSQENLLANIRRDADLVECSKTSAKFWVEYSFGGDGGKTRKKIDVTFTLKGHDKVLIEANKHEWSGWLFFPSEPEISRLWGVFQFRLVNQ